MSSPLQRIAKFSALALLGTMLVACGGGESPAAAAKSEPSTSAPSAVQDAAADAGKETMADAKEAMADVTDVAETTGAAIAATEPDLAAGEATYGRFCFSCHAAGVAGAPKLGDVEAWAPRIAKGLDMLVATSIEGIPPGMPAKGLCMSCTEEDLRNAIAWMIAQ